jgi:dipeptidyl aminopeptidase/acylaminoacyl peptidase
MKRPIQGEDIAKLQFVSDPQISPDGTRIAYVVTETLLEEKRYRSRIWLASTAGGHDPILLTRGNGKDTSPRWSPDGSELAFLTDRWEKTQIAIMKPDFGEAQQVSDLADGIQSFDWTPTGRGFLVQAKADENQTLTHRSVDSNKDEKASDDDTANEPKRITALAHKLDGSGFRDGRRTHIAVVLRSGRIVQLTAGDYDHIHPALSPCRRYLAFTSNQSPERDNERRADIWLMDLENDTVQRITNHDGIYGLPQFSADSSFLAFVGHRVKEPYGPTNLDRLWVSDLTTGALKVLTEGIDREMSGSCAGDSKYGIPAQRPQWTTDRDDLLSLMSDRGNVGLVRLVGPDAYQTTAGGNREVMSFSLSTTGTIAFSASDPVRPAEIYVCDTDGTGERQITHHNTKLLEQLEVSAPVHIPYNADDGTEIDAWLIEPITRKDNVKYPLVLEIHGGPHSMYGNTFFHEFQLLAAQGYGVLYTNPRGSTGYGQEFVSAAMGDWGGLDYRDVMTGLDAALERFDWIDHNRLGVTGGSYGGYLVNWIVTQTDRFSAAITQRSTCNRHNLFGSSDLVWTYTEWEFRGLPWDSTDHYYDRSPITHVEHVSTPILIMHSENDLRCPIEQGEQWFIALKRLGKETEFVRFPEESHELSRSGRPDRRIERLRWMLDWLGRHL